MTENNFKRYLRFIEMEMRLIEEIKCKCGNVFAACVDGHQDNEWRKERREYVLGGCSVSFTDTPTPLGHCDCPKTPKQIMERVQLELFK